MKLKLAKPVIAIAVAGLALAACSSAPKPAVHTHVSTPSERGTGATKGSVSGAVKISPVGTVNGYIQAMRAGDTTLMCKYVIPSGQSLCTKVYSTQMYSVSQLQTVKAQMESRSKLMRVGNFVVSGNEAIVSLLSGCPTNSSNCIPNSNPNAGLPTSTVPFSKAFTNAITPNTTGKKHAIGLVLVSGKWYVDI